MRRTPFYKQHEDHGAKFVDFAGWQMPISYGSIIEEHQHVRHSAGLFDVSHMGRIWFSGRHARRFLERVLTRRISDMAERTCRYSLVCNAQGGVMDDVIVYRMENEWLVVCNAANRQKLLDHFEAHQNTYVFKMQDKTLSTAMVAIQGPKVMDLIGRFSSEVPRLKRYAFCEKNLLILRMLISRTGYTGEDGVEVILDAHLASKAMTLLTKGGAKETDSLRPVGLGARDTLRLEAGMPLYGHELNEQTDPFAAGLGFAVDLDKDNPVKRPESPSFIGQKALREIRANGPVKRLIGLRCEGRRTPRPAMTITCGTKTIGSVTSGSLSPTLGYPIAMAYVNADSCQTGDLVAIDIGNRLVDAEVVPLPFYRLAKPPVPSTRIHEACSAASLTD